MDKVANWGFNYENEVMKGYCEKAFDDLARYGDVEISDEQRKAFFQALGWAIDELTASEALAYYNNH